MIFNRGNKNVQLEELLKKEAANYRVYPSEKVWENIRDVIQPETKWPALITIFVSIVLALSISTIINYPSEKIGNSKSAGFSTNIKTNTPVIQISKPKKPIFFAQNFYEAKAEIKSINKIKVEKEVIEHDIIQSSKETQENTTIVNENETQTNFVNSNVNQSDKISTFTQSDLNNFLTEAPIEFAKTKTEINFPGLAETSFSENNKSKINIISENGFLKTQQNKIIKKYNNKLRLQYYVTLSNSYRTLDDDKTRSRYTSAIIDRIALNRNVNDIVIHKPMLGLEIGGAIMYPITKRLFIKTGIQFNIRQYNIDAFNAYGAANISYVNNFQLNTYSAISGFSTNFENAIGAKTNLQNKLYELSIPLGLEWDVIDGNKWGLRLNGSFQPTVALNRSNHIISTDYKYYTDATPFFRRFNINSDAGILFTMKTKNVKWFLGPQVRFQQLPTYNDLYPIKEYRVDYGVKIGFTKSLH